MRVRAAPGVVLVEVITGCEACPRRSRWLLPCGAPVGLCICPACGAAMRPEACPAPAVVSFDMAWPAGEAHL